MANMYNSASLYQFALIRDIKKMVPKAWVILYFKEYIILLFL